MVKMALATGRAECIYTFVVGIVIAYLLNDRTGAAHFTSEAPVRQFM